MVYVCSKSKFLGRVQVIEEAVRQRGLAEACPVAGDPQREEDQRQDDVGMSAGFAQTGLPGVKGFDGQVAKAMIPMRDLLRRPDRAIQLPVGDPGKAVALTGGPPVLGRKRTPGQPAKEAG